MEGVRLEAARFRRLFTTAEEATQSYPMDPQAWYALGEVRLHYGPYTGMPLQHARAAFERYHSSR